MGVGNTTTTSQTWSVFTRVQQEREPVMAPEEKVDDMWGRRSTGHTEYPPTLATGHRTIRKVPLSPWLPLCAKRTIVSKRIDPPSSAR